MKKIFLFMTLFFISINVNGLTFSNGEQVPEVSDQEKIHNLEELLYQLNVAGEMGLTVDFDVTAKTFGFKNFAEAVNFYAKINKVKVNVEQAKEAFIGIDKTIKLEYTKENFDKLYEIIVSSNYGSAKDYKNKYLKEGNDKAFSISMNLEKELAKLAKNPNLKEIAAHTWNWGVNFSSPTAAIPRSLDWCGDTMVKYKIPFQQCYIIDVNGQNYFYDYFVDYIKNDRPTKLLNEMEYPITVFAKTKWEEFDGCGISDRVFTFTDPTNYEGIYSCNDNPKDSFTINGKWSLISGQKFEKFNFEFQWPGDNKEYQETLFIDYLSYEVLIDSDDTDYYGDYDLIDISYQEKEKENIMSRDRG